MTHKTEVSLTIPHIEDLVCIDCKVNYAEMRSPIIKSLFHCQILTCRLIIYTVKCCIASPSIDNIGDLVHVVVNKKFYLTGKLQEHLLHLKVKFDEPTPVDLKIYEACLKYTFTFKIAPYWNLIDKSCYVYGPDFLKLSTSVDALEWNILFQDDATKLEMVPLKIKFEHLTSEFLNLPSGTMETFMKETKRNVKTINLPLFQCPWVYVLPKLSKARIVSISKTLPDSCLFENYNDLCRHWKNMYSYRLPKSDQGLFFYEVVFPINPHELFTYPEICILSKKPEFFSCDSKNEIASKFIKNFSTNVHSVCGEVIKIGQLHTKIDKENSYILKQQINHAHEKSIDELRSPYFKTPNYYSHEKSICKSSSHFKTSNDYIVKSASEKLNLSSLFTFKGGNEMSESLKSHEQQILSIINGPKRKKSTVTQNSQCTTQIISKNSHKNLRQDHFSQQTLKSLTPMDSKKTEIGDIDYICSFYDIPSMYPKSPELFDENNYTHNGAEKNDSSKSNIKYTSQASKYTSHLNKVSNKRPIIKNVENVCFDLKDIRKIKTAYDTNRVKPYTQQRPASNKLNRNQDVEGLSNKCNKKDPFLQISEHKNFQYTLPKDKVQNKDAPLNIFNDSNNIDLINQTQLSIFPKNFDTLNESKNLSPKLDYDDDDEFRTSLQRFDKHVIESNDNFFNEDISNEKNNFSFECNLQKSQEELFQKFDSCENWGKLKDESRCTNISEETEIQEYETHDSKISSSLKNKSKGQEIRKCEIEPKLKQTNSRFNKTNMNFSRSQKNVPSVDSLFCALVDSNKECINKKFLEMKKSPMSSYSLNKLQEQFKLNENNKCVADALQFDTICKVNGKRNEVLLQESIQSTQSFKEHRNLSPISIFNSNENFKSMCLSDNESLHDDTPDIFELSNNSLENSGSNNLPEKNGNSSSKLYSKVERSDNCDFASLLSLSSNDSESDSCENYKQACNEASSIEN